MLWQGERLAGVDERATVHLLNVVDGVHDVALAAVDSDPVERVPRLDGVGATRADEPNVSGVRGYECHDEQGTYGHRYQGE